MTRCAEWACACPSHLRDGRPVSRFDLLVGIVGPCGSGKSTLVAGLTAKGYRCRHIAQEHSGVPAMWSIMTRPDVLVYLEVSFETSTRRRHLSWTRRDYENEISRLANARQHAHLVIPTDALDPGAVLQTCLDFLARREAALREREGN